MTVLELATSTQRNIYDIFEALSLSDPLKQYDKNTVINQNILYDVVRKLGSKFKVIPRPDSKEKETKDYDVTKRYKK